MNTQEQYCDCVLLPENLSIRSASDIYSRIIDEFRARDAVAISIPESAEADLSFVQLVESARRQAKAQGKTFTLASPATGSVLKVLERAGFIESFGKEDTKFWLHKEVTL
jgi:hypothetical protein